MVPSLVSASQGREQASPPSFSPVAGSRLEYLDLARGGVMILMALDHVSYFWNASRMADEGLRGNFTAYVDVPQLLNRVMTHFAPTTFIWMAGFMVAISATRRLQAGVSEDAIARHFTIRGLLIIVLHLTIVNLGFEMEGFLKGDWREIFYLQVLWTIGINLIALAWLRRLGSPVLVVVTLLNLFAFPFFYEPLLQFTHPNPGFYALGVVTFAPSLAYDSPVYCIYPVIPWMGVMTFGYLAGQWFLRQGHVLSSEALTKLLLWLGTGMLLAFLLLRFLNGYGNQIPWRTLSFQEFLTLSKYPPSLAYLLFTFPQMLMLIALSLNVESSWLHRMSITKAVKTLGRTPLFFYCIHPLFFGFIPVLAGIQHQFSLVVVYVVWLAGLPILYKACEWYLRFKLDHPRSLLKYV